MLNLKIMKDLSVCETNNVPNVPVSIHDEHLSDFYEHCILPHWNTDFEMLSIVSGTMKVIVDGHVIHAKPADVIVINVGRTHQFLPDGDSDCHYYCILASPKIFVDDLAIHNDIMSALLDYIRPGFFYLDRDTPERLKIIKMIDELEDLQKNQPPAYPLTVVGLLHMILAQLYVSQFYYYGTAELRRKPDEDALRAMLSYTKSNYAAHIRLDDIASAGNVCRSRCCSIFRTYLNQTPIEFLTDYRLNISRTLLASRAIPIASIAAQCGFSSQSYFTKQFVRKYSMTPRQYRSHLKWDLKASAAADSDEPLSDL